MKIAVVNTSGNTGKTTVTRHVLEPRMPGVKVFSVGGYEEIPGADIEKVHIDMQDLDTAIVDMGILSIGNALSVWKQQPQLLEDFDYFIVPTVPEEKQQNDAISTIKRLAHYGVPPKKIKLVLNMVNADEIRDIPKLFKLLLSFVETEKLCMLNPGAAVLRSEIFDILFSLNKSVTEVLADDTDYRGMLREATDLGSREYTLNMLLAKSLAKSVNQNLDDVFQVLFHTEAQQEPGAAAQATQTVVAEPQC